MIDAQTTYVTKKGIKELQKQIERLRADCNELRNELREMDKTESHDDRLARIEKMAQLELLDHELNKKEALVMTAKHLPRKRDALKVAVGSVVDLLDTSGRIVRYTLVESFEANPADGRISIKSPLGQNLVGKSIQEIVEWTAGFTRHRMQLVGIG